MKTAFIQKALDVTGTQHRYISRREITWSRCSQSLYKGKCYWFQQANPAQLISMLIFCLPTGTLFPVSSKKQMDFWLSDLLLLTPYYICAKEHSDLLKKGYFRTLVNREKGDQQTWDTS